MLGLCLLEPLFKTPSGVSHEIRQQFQIGFEISGRIVQQFLNSFEAFFGGHLSPFAAWFLFFIDFFQPVCQ